MRILVACRLNQARSIIAAAFLRKHLPTAEIYSAGVQAVTGSIIPEVIYQIAQEWGLHIQEESCLNARDVEDISGWDLIICSDNEVALELEILGFATKNLVYLAEYADFPALVPRDPVGMNYLKTQVELAKVLLLVSRAIRVLENQVHSEVFAKYRNYKEEECAHLISSLSDSNIDFVIDTRLRFPNANSWQKLGLPVGYFILSSDSHKLERDQESTFLVSKEEIKHEARCFVSTQWRDLIEEASRSGSIVVIPHADKENNATYFLSLMWTRRGLQ